MKNPSLGLESRIQALNGRLTCMSPTCLRLYVLQY